jgi:Thaumatin family/Malectin domain
MKAQGKTLLVRSCIYVAVGFLLLSLAATAQTRQFTIKNNCSETVWLAGAGTPTPVFNGSPGGLEMAPGTTVTTSVPVPWVAGRFWGRRNCTFDSSGHGSCSTGDCGQLQCTHAGAGTTTLAEFTLTGSTTGSDNYDISLVDAFDFPVSIQLDDATPGHCINPACQADLRNFCPADMQNKDASGNVVGCKSLCGKFGTPNYCCAGPYGVPGACNNVAWNLNFRATGVKNRCPSVYGYAYDDASSDFNCHPPANPGYIITFCPASGVANTDPNTTPTFTIAAIDDNQTVAPGASVTYHLNVTASSTFSGTVSLGAAHLPQSCTWDGTGKASCSAAASKATFDRPSVTLTPGATVPVAMTIQTTANPAPILGTAAIEVIGQSGALQNVWEGALTVADPAAPDYTLQVSPSSSQTVTPGSSVVYNLTVTSKNGFTGTVTLMSFGAPAGTSTFSSGTLSFAGSSQAQTATLTLATSTTAKAKTYFPLITAFSANRLHDFQGTLTLSSSSGSPDFTISASPGSQSVPIGGSTTYTVATTAQNGFTGTVALSVSGLPSGATASFTPASINGAGSSSLSVTTSGSTPAGTFALTITGASGSLSHSTKVTLAVGSPVTSVQINSGGPAVSPFAADEDFTGGSTINHANTIDLSGVTSPAPMAVYQTARVGNFTYTIPGFTAGSSHTVRLHFAETFFNSAGSRTFNVSINGTQVLSNFDIFAAASAQNKAVIKQFTVNANSSGQYVVQFTSVVNQSLLSGIEVQ